MFDFYKEALGLEAEASLLRRHLHENPEVSFCEYKTCAFIREKLTGIGIPFESAGDTGTIAVINKGKSGPVLALRADIDALEINEKTDILFKSKNPGVMHACGHDAHTAALLCAAKMLYHHSNEIPGTVKLIFQPAEETGFGALKTIETGLLHDVDAFFGIHVNPDFPVGKIGVKSGGVMAGSNSLIINIKGKSGHGGYPNRTVDAIAAGSELVEALQHIVSREIGPTEQAVISVCQFHAGTRDNIIAGEAQLSGTVRVTNEEMRSYVADAIRRIAGGIALAHRVEAEVICDPVTLVMYNAPELYGAALKAAQWVIKDSPEDFTPQMGTEDFSRYSQLAPVFFAFVGSGGGFPLHSDHFYLDEGAVSVAAALHTAFVYSYFEQKK
ncbi:thermostable carboxypeptidase 1 [Treponema primitia ZAS-2]|uniref:Thermostable carboxypeptidase 1 n=1 Tax=Treponema primitia (strain ATCC BAA-887 / DSM 12427 / ZAS-2) TaxID=545694 RepID=F5YHX5_TREPZ|nr:M20 family metallopeptidase [Treponema primitia]AEF84621.1 thermostable carboxypeptidase 1 [Treponema primitia ZAS-2]